MTTIPPEPRPSAGEVADEKARLPPPAVKAIKLSNPAQMEIIRAVTSRGAMIRTRAWGGSMFPFIRSGDVLTIAPVGDARLRPGDVAAARVAGSGRLAVHRIVASRGRAYLFRGDNSSEADRWIPVADVLGVVVRVERRGRRVRLGLGPDRFLIAFLNRIGLLNRLTAASGFLVRFARNELS